MTTFWGDLETYSETPIKHGVYRYAEACEIMLFSWAINDEPVRVVDFTTPDAELEAIELEELIARADEVVFQNSMFDRTVLALQAPRFCAPLHKWRDTMVQALAHSLQGGLDKLCVILDVPHDVRKMAEGKALIQLFCKPRPKNQTLRRATRETHPAEWKTFVDYAGHDIEAMRYIRKRLPNWNYSGAELDLWHLDQRINDRGVAVDVDFASAAIRTAERVQKRLAARASELTASQVTSTTQRDKLLAHILGEYGVQLPDMKGDTIERRISDPELPWQVRELLNNRLEATRASTAKYKALLRSVSRDGRLRGTTQFAGAQRTGRWAGRLFQPQNLMRTPKFLAGDKQVDFAAECIASDAVDLVMEGLPYKKDDGTMGSVGTMEVLAAGVPWAIVAPKGRKLVAPDLSNIEGRVLAWLAGEQWKLDAFRAQDADPKNKTKDLYIIGYAKSFSEAIADVVKDFEAGGKKRQIGKVQELALGYQGGVGAFVSMAGVYRIDLADMARDALAPGKGLPRAFFEKALKALEKAKEEDRTFGLADDVFVVCHSFAHMWRGANPNTQQLWWDLQDAVRGAIRSPGTTLNVGRLKTRRDGNWLRIQLPSGRFLCYPNPKVHPETGKISYKGVNQYTRKWQTIDTYGGKLAENVTQAVARDVLAAAMPNAEEAGYEIVMHVHDELVAEVPDTDEYSADELGEILATNPPWADGLPLAVGGYETYRYRKD